MATQLFFRDEASDIHRGDNTANSAGTTTGWVAKRLATTRGSGVVSGTTNTVTGATNGVDVTSVGSGRPLEWYSPPFSADTTISGTITFNIWAAESSMNANVAINCVVERLDDEGGVVSTIIRTTRTTEIAITTRAVNNFTGTPTSTTVLKGERVRVRIFGDDAGTMATGFTFSTSWSGTTAAADGDSYVTFNETFSFLTTAPAGTQLFLTDTTGPAVGANDERLMTLTRGGGSATAVRNSQAGWAAPVQYTATAGGTAIEWYTNPLSAFTLSGLVTANLWIHRTSAGGSGLRVEVAVCNTDGSSAAVYGAIDVIDTATSPTGATGAGTSAVGVITTSSALIRGYISGQDVAVTDGQRIRVRIFHDDAAEFASSSGGTNTLTYSGTSGGSSGDSFITLSQSVTESATNVTPSVVAVSATVNAPTITASATPTPSVVAVSASIPTPAIPVLAEPAVVAVSATVHAPTIATSVVPSVVAVSATVNAPTITRTATPTPSVVSVSASIYDGYRKDYSALTFVDSFNVGAQTFNASDVAFSTDGLRMFVLSADSGDNIYSYTLTAPYEISTATHLATSNVAITGTGVGMTFSTDGVYVYIVNFTSTVRRYTLSTPWDITTMGSVMTWTPSGAGSSIQDVNLSPDGTSAYILTAGSTDRIYQYSLSTPYVINSGVSSVGNVSVTTPTNQTGLQIDELGKTVLISDSSNERIVTYMMATAWDITSLYALTPAFVSVATDTDSIRDVFVPQGVGGRWLFGMSTATDKVARYTFGSIVQATANVSPSVVAVAVTIYDPTVATSASTTVEPDVVAISATPNAPTITASATPTPSTVEISASPQAPTIVLSITTTPNVVQISATPHAPTITASATPTPSAVSISVSIPAPTITASATPTPDVVSIAASTYTPSIVASAAPAPDAVAVLAVVGVPDIATTATVAVSVVAVSATTPTPTIAASATVAPSVVTVLASVHAPTVDVAASSTATPDVVAVAATTYAPTVTASATVSPSVISVAASVHAPTVDTSVISTPSVVAVAATPYTPTVTASSTVVADVVAVTASPQAPTILSGTNPVPSEVSVVASPHTPTITASATLTPAVAAVAATVHAPTIDVSVTTTPNVVSIAATTYTPTITASATPTPAIVAVAASTYVPTIAVTGAVVAPTVSVVATPYTPTISVSVAAAPVVVAVAVSTYTPTITASATLSPSVVEIAASVHAPTLSTAVTVAPSVVAVLASVHAPTVDVASYATPSVVAVVATVHAPSIDGASVVLTVEIVVTIWPPSVFAGVIPEPNGPLVTSGYTRINRRTSGYDSPDNTTSGYENHRPTSGYDQRDMATAGYSHRRRTGGF